ncbi:tRNA threonylcarbamoyl adenosine modification protein YeaZ [Neorhizobium galegae]|uniref:tRNA (adenosine(37)-N6)-threonylcarbamoyltransferase complex dimerization subunit type 1 TsaB n=1 Tax=Neorhizobium galegae TaxID=399 RepID=UPI001AE5B162|nr:tRNA (adenosine(37)-N6)-threonylcarbamoyltransferase complex dimerization subunit type 1 TsaB [Neorhizobium galegae]MBP2548231.1 tRNA threonylcarbamoyl adenosine modification protein YeaZ [Neorhizobium galegae]
MMLLAIDTAGVDCSAAVYDASQGKILAEVTDRIGKGHAERLMAMIDEVLETAGVALSDITRVAVTIGPGSFTGIRVGVAAARGLALALPADAVGVTTLSALARAHLANDASRPVIAAMDAKRDEIYAQVFGTDGAPITEAAAVSLEDLRHLAEIQGAAVTGSAASLLSGEGAASEPDRFDIGIVARLGAEVEAHVARPKPLYLRGPDAKPQDGFALSRA